MLNLHNNASESGAWQSLNLASKWILFHSYRDIDPTEWETDKTLIVSTMGLIHFVKSPNKWITMCNKKFLISQAYLKSTPVPWYDATTVPSHANFYEFSREMSADVIVPVQQWSNVRLQKYCKAILQQYNSTICVCNTILYISIYMNVIFLMY